MNAGDDVATRRWRLRGYRKGDKDKKPSFETVERGDQALSAAVARLEADPTVVRIAAEQTW
jgi:hypothetical protein